MCVIPPRNWVVRRTSDKTPTCSQSRKHTPGNTHTYAKNIDMCSPTSLWRDIGSTSLFRAE